MVVNSRASSLENAKFWTMSLEIALSEVPAFGYGLWRALSRQKGITTASVYQHLSELERASLVRRSRVVKFKGRERIFYELTRKGRELLKALRKTMG
jgi:DNA-binding PadR family transcriptional regulator